MRYPTGRIAVSLCVVVSACGPAKTAGTDGHVVDRVRVVPTNNPYEVTFQPAGPSSSKENLAFPANRVWSLLPSVYSVLSIPVTGIDSVNQVIGGSVSARRSWGNWRVSQLLDCGSSITGPNADNYSVQIKLTTRVEATAPEASRVRTMVDATGTSTRGSLVRCSSTGELEMAIVAKLQQGLAQ